MFEFTCSLRFHHLQLFVDEIGMCVGEDLTEQLNVSGSGCRTSEQSIIQVFQPLGQHKVRVRR